MCPTGLICLAIFLCCELSLSEKVDSAVDHRCAWMGSGSPPDKQAVRSVRFDCSEGRLTWKYPEGALIARLHPPHNRQSWRFCVRPLKGHLTNSVVIYRKENSTLTPLTLDGESCFESSRWLTVFMQTVHSDKASFQRKPAGFFFTVTTVPISEQDITPQAACPPCGEEELVEAFCSADLIFHGQLLQATKDQLEFAVDKVVRRPMHEEAVFGQFRPKSTLLTATLRFGGCSSSHLAPGASGQPHLHLVIGRSRLGGADLVCAPLLEDFLSTANKFADRAPCELR